LALSPLPRLRRAIRERDSRSLAPLNLPLPRELEELKHTINDLLARMRRVRANQERFIGDASHQLRTPLAGLSAHAELALRQQDPSAWHAALGQMQATASHTAHLANQLLSLTRLNNPEVQPPRVPLELSALARATVSRLFLRCDRAGVDLGLEIAPDIDGAAWTLGVEWQLEEALANLIDNACKHGARTVTLTLSRMAAPSDATFTQPDSAALAGRWRLSVEDDGPGIDAERRLLVLRPFHRNTQPDSHDQAPAQQPDELKHHEGAGLGLAIVDGIARHHDARLTLSDATARSVTQAADSASRTDDATRAADANGTDETGASCGLCVSLHLAPCAAPEVRVGGDDESAQAGKPAKTGGTAC
ncbi:HAMP domain-containing sensor histidine kinase, partial [uncultured Cobetia sp.]|uniref:sensor histidine kinase n=1 Tax=uncultured Cobetia sp. TaxID=410706 RepID=UPI0030EF16CA